MRHSMWRVVAVVAFASAGLWSCAEENNCGAAGTNSFMGSGGNCECQPGTTWASPEQVGDYTCVPINGGLGPLCTPNCRGLACGDDLCGGSCGTCAAGTFCNGAGQCELGNCTPDCSGRECGADPLCSQSCGTCASGQTCTNAGQCEAACTPNCAGKQCGSDGCGGSCGTCTSGTFCNSSFQCESGSCTADCSGRACGPDPVCGQSCGTCPGGETCNTAGQCVGTPAGSPVGGPCAQDADCAGDTAACLTDGFPGGYCIITACHEVGCDDGSTCFYLNEEQTESACFVTCETAAECRDGYECDSYGTCWPPVDLPEGNVGAPCTADTDCTGAANKCLTEDEGMPSGYCTQEGCSNGTCSEGSECFSFSDGTSLCLQSCVNHDECREGYACFDPGACWAGSPGCTPEDCAAGTFCASNGECVPDPPADMPAGPVPDCSGTISWECAAASESACGQVVAFEPDTGAGWWDYPINGETETNEYRSYCRSDLMQLVKYAAAQVECLAGNWTYGNGGPIGLGDMSEADGSIPGTSIGSPGHPEGTHVNGHDMDLAYFQVGTADNRLRAICEHYIDNEEQYHCVGPADLLDGWRTALFIGKLHDTPQLRVIGADGKAGPELDEKIAQLCYGGWLDGPACTNPRLTYEVENQNHGWYYFHHHHFHISIVDRPAVGWMSGLPPPGWYAGSSCMTLDCSESNWDAQRLLPINAPRTLRR